MLFIFKLFPEILEKKKCFLLHIFSILLMISNNIQLFDSCLSFYFKIYTNKNTFFPGKDKKCFNFEKIVKHFGSKYCLNGKGLFTVTL